MKIISRICLLSLIVFVLYGGCSGQNQESAEVKQDTNSDKQELIKAEEDTTQADSILVTFIELGSVKCVPCKMMQPIMDEIEEEYPDQVKVVFHDVWTEDGKPYAVKYGIRVIPTQIFLDKNGEEYFRHEGFFPKEELIEILKKQGVQ